MNVPSRAQVFHSPADRVKADHRTIACRHTSGVTVTCAVCKAQVGSTLPPGGHGSRVVQRHRPGGGTVSLRRGDVPCMGGRA